MVRKANPAFERAVMAAIDFLRRADRDRAAKEATRRAFQILRKKHLPLHMELVVDHPPASCRVDYDVLISDADGTTTMLGWHRDEGRPWSIDYADHWAANFVVTVNKRHLTIFDTLTFMRAANERGPDLAQQLIDAALIAEAVAADPPKVDEEEIARAGEIFRIQHGLLKADEMTAWLDASGTTPAAWKQWLETSVQTAKFKDRLCRGRIEPYFAKHRRQLAPVLVHKVTLRERGAASELARLAQEVGLFAAVCTARWKGLEADSDVEMRRADELAAEHLAQGIGTCWGPLYEGSRHCLFEIKNHGKAKLDAATRATIRSRLVARWLDEQREKASIEWHW